MSSSSLSNATLLITGGTGSFGTTVLKHFLTSDIKQIRILSRDEKKQDDMRHSLQSRFPEYYNKVKFYIGDVRNYQSVGDAMHGVDYVFHAAALKEVPSCEFFPMEAVATNIHGTDNVACCHRVSCKKCCMPLHGQSRLSHKLHGYIKSDDGTCSFCKS